MNEKQQQLTFDKGITNVPSDAICSDNALEESLGMVYDNGEHRVMQKPKEFFTSAQTLTSTLSFIPKILYVHKFNGEERYIAAMPNTFGHVFAWGIKDGTVLKFQSLFSINNAAVPCTAPLNVTSIGKTLIVTNATGLHYFIWSYDTSNSNAPEYNHLGDTLPAPNVEFLLGGMNESQNKVTAEEERGSNWLEDNGHGVYIGVNPLHQSEWNNLIVGLHSKNKKDLHQKKRFWGSFAIRVALKMYDGSYAMVSNPILMFNQFQMPAIARIFDVTVQMGMFGQQLKYKKNANLTAWKDIVSEIVIFVSRESTLFDTTSDAICSYYEPSGGFAYGACLSGNTKYGVNRPVGVGDLYTVLNNIENEGVKELSENGLFYKLCSIGLEQSTDWETVDDKISTSTLENITTQEQLAEDDYFGHNSFVPGLLYAYNSRLNMANVSRSIFEGFSNFLPYDNSSNNTYTIYVKIITDTGERVVKKAFSTKQKQGIWFYYPDSRATHVTIYKGGSCILNEELKEHPTLHGAYYFKGNLTTGDDEPSAISPVPSTALTDADLKTSAEILPNYVIQSEVNNPYVFKAAGYFKVGTGRIVGMSTITQALSEGQFGQYPLLVFSESGIWSLSVASTGYYDSIHPMSREVALLDNPCITQTDGAVFFASAKGLMVVVSNQVKCVSEQLGGKSEKPFADFLKTAIIAYDYRDSLLWIFDKTSTACYIYSIKSSTFGKYDFGSGNVVTHVVNYYPDYLIQSSTVYSLLQRPNINKDGTTVSVVTTGTPSFNPNTYECSLITRPMKLENALALKSIMQVRHIADFKPYTITTPVENPETHEHTSDDVTPYQGTVALKIFASNNLNNWVELHSLRGTPWKYYRFQYVFTNLIATDRFAGTMLITQERRTNKLR